LAGSDIQTNPPATNEWIDANPRQYTRQVDQLPPRAVIDEIEQKVNMVNLEQVLMEEGIRKFADPQKALEKSIGERRAKLAAAK
jgi:transaldolase